MILAGKPARSFPAHAIGCVSDAEGGSDEPALTPMLAYGARCGWKLMGGKLVDLLGRVSA